MDKLILECEIDERIETGVFDVHDVNHITVLIERMVEYGIDEDEAERIVELGFVDEGKYPERQAYNKDGWLVTFPSKEYRDRAIKKGTHSISDPTHGKGGMNLYYKRKGKQKRQAAQQTTSTNTPERQKQPTPAQKTTQEPVPSEPSQKQPEQSPEEDFVDFSAEDDELEKYIASKAGPDFKVRDKQSNGGTPAPDAGGEENKPSHPIPAKPTPKQAQPTPVSGTSYSDISKKFAAQKRWIPSSFGEYRNSQGDAVAVVGLSGEIVPIKSNEREEYKLFAEKHMQA